MTIILSGKKYARDMKNSLQKTIAENKRSDFYVAILFFGDNYGSRIYTKMKKKFGEEIGMNVRILWQEKNYDTSDVLALIQTLNNDQQCIGIMVQLPLPTHLEADKWRILTAIDHKKDIDGLWGEAFGKALVLEEGFMPATPAAVIGLLDHYHVTLKGKIVAVIGQSLLVGSPLATILMQRGASVFSCNEYADQQTLKSITKKSDIIIACTWVVHLIDQSYIRDDQSQTVIDVGYGQKNGKPAGDLDVDSVAPFLQAYSPVPGGVGPATIAHLFNNITVLKKVYWF